MAVHYAPNVRYRPQTEQEALLISDAHARNIVHDPYRVKCKKCGKKIRSSGHVTDGGIDGICKNGK